MAVAQTSGLPAASQVPDVRPKIEVPVTPPAHSGHIADAEPTVVHVPADRSCLYHCAVAAQDSVTILRLHRIL